MNKYTLRQTPLAAAIGTVVAGGAHAATITVTTNADGPLGSITGECTLRAAVAAAHQDAAVDGCTSGSPGADDIVFDTSLENSTITLNVGQMQITEPLSITGPVPGDSAGLAISGDNASRIFHVQATEFELDSLTLMEGRTTLDTARGGAIYADDATLSLEQVLLTDNSTTGTDSQGGAIFARNGETNLTDSRVSGNQTTGTGGYYSGTPGGGLEFSRGDATLTNTRVTGNSASGRGGGISAPGTNLQLINSTISGNTTDSLGGGIFISDGALTVTDSTLTVTNSTISGNTASSNGGGIFAGSSTDSIALIHATVANNFGGGIHRGSSAPLGLLNTLIVQSDGNPACSDTADKYTGSMATDYSCTGTATPGATYIEPLANNGGSTQTHALMYQNPARNAADAKICANSIVNSVDQRGQPRPGEGTSECDIGAFEWQLLGDVIFEDRFEDGG